MILVTGHLGFIGQETAKILGEYGKDWLGYDLMEGQDIRDVGQLDAFVSRKNPSRILHLAAIARFGDADAAPLLAHETNVLGTQNVLTVAAKRHIPVVYASTGSVLMPLNKYTPPYSETIPPRGNSVYGCTKAIAELLVRQHTPHIILRYAHIYGKEKRFSGLVGVFIERIKRGLQPELYGGRQTNDFIYVKDVAYANKVALEAPYPAWNQTYNIGTGHELTAREAGETLLEKMNYDGEMKVTTPRTFDGMRFAFDVSKAERMLGFKAGYDFAQGLEDMLNDAA